ncbi:hypothetical protein [Hymenobacter sp. CRA2]|uniref:hypothetical protein n=1 Tax=Hymenobacter sp. CRA2 TaxID=1955620 RepID=UPI001115D19E|nr:hypothetical protein [Hymenobacter sp. CRA2]
MNNYAYQSQTLLSSTLEKPWLVASPLSTYLKDFMLVLAAMLYGAEPRPASSYFLPNHTAVITLSRIKSVIRSLQSAFSALALPRTPAPDKLGWGYRRKH